MSFPQNPIGNRPRDPYEGYKTEEIQPDKHEREKSPKSQNPLAIVGAYILLLMQKFLYALSDKTENKVSSTSEKEIRDNLLLFKAAFELLKLEDKSQDIEYLNRVSELWHQSLEDSLFLPPGTPVAKTFRAFIKSVQEYPPGEEHTLAYYLSHYAGQKWLPFPYMELIAKIYKEHQDDPAHSILTLWTEQIDELIHH